MAQKIVITDLQTGSSRQQKKIVIHYGNGSKQIINTHHTFEGNVRKVVETVAWNGFKSFDYY